MHVKSSAQTKDGGIRLEDYGETTAWDFFMDTNNQLNIQYDSGASPTLTIANGKVGIGTTSPGAKLELYGTDRFSFFVNGTKTSGGALFDFTVSERDDTWITSGRAKAWNWCARYDGYFSGDTSGLTYELYGTKKGGGYYAPIVIQSDGDVILASPKSATSGNVGIGTTSPGAKLNIYGGELLINNIGSAEKGIIFTEGTGTDKNFAILYDGTGSGGDNRLDIETDLGGGTVMSLKGNGNVGIGTTNPGAMLDVAGTGQFNAINMDGNIDLDGYDIVDADQVYIDDLYDYGTGTMIEVHDDFDMNDENIYDANTIQCNTLEDPEDSTLAVSDSLEVTGSISAKSGSYKIYEGTNLRGYITGGWDSSYNELIVFKNAAGNKNFYFTQIGRGFADHGWYTFSPYVSMHFIPDNKEKKDYEIGDVVAIDNWKVIKTNNSYDKTVIGVIATDEGFISIPKELKEELKNNKSLDDFDVVPVAYLGDIKVKVCNENGPIKSGDLLVSSSISGVAMKGTPESFEEYAAVIGKAREDFNGVSGEIMVAVGVK